MIRHGKAPFSEVSSEGDKRFSAFYAKVDGRSIEEWYQAAKVFHNGMGFVTGLNWREAKGRKPVNGTEVRKIYSDMWDRYIAEHPELLAVIQRMSGVQDMFGVPGHVCQATELWRIRCESLTLFTCMTCYGESVGIEGVTNHKCADSKRAPTEIVMAEPYTTHIGEKS